MTLEELTSAALQLAPPHRAELVERLIVSLQQGDATHPEWSAELDRRDAELDRDPRMARPAGDVFHRLRSRFAE